MTPQWVGVTSSAVKALAFEVKGEIPQKDGTVENWGRLYVRFHSDDTYAYEPCITAQFVTLLNADSIGRSLWHVLVPGTGKKVFPPTPHPPTQGA